MKSIGSDAHSFPTRQSAHTSVTLSASRRETCDAPLRGSRPKEPPCDHQVMPRMRNQLSYFSLGKREGDELWRQREAFGLAYTPGHGGGWEEEKEVGRGTPAQGSALFSDRR